jgi:hypothetical protein
MSRRVRSQSVVELLVVSAIKSVVGYLAVVICKPALDWLAAKFRNLLKSKDKNESWQKNSEKNSDA